jgi:hypothetical protein
VSHTQAAIQGMAAAFAINNPEHRATYQEALEAMVQLACAELIAEMQLGVIADESGVRH